MSRQGTGPDRRRSPRRSTEAGRRPAARRSKAPPPCPCDRRSHGRCRLGRTALVSDGAVSRVGVPARRGSQACVSGAGGTRRPGMLRDNGMVAPARGPLRCAGSPAGRRRPGSGREHRPAADLRATAHEGTTPGGDGRDDPAEGGGIHDAHRVRGPARVMTEAGRFEVRARPARRPDGAWSGAIRGADPRFDPKAPARAHPPVVDRRLCLFVHR